MASLPDRPPAGQPAILAAGFAFLAALAAILGAWGFEKIGGYVPCQLCLAERIPYYVGVPVALLALVSAAGGWPRAVTALLLLATAGIFAWSAWLGIYHAGAEWGFWLGPADCGAGAAPPPRDAGDLLSQLQGMRIVSCTEASWRFPDAAWGLSFAGWNAAVSLAIVVVTLGGLALGLRRRAA
jgi:disulfide bond formation protein DsbB